MKILQKILVILIITICTLGIVPQNISMAKSQLGTAIEDITGTNPDESVSTDDLETIIGKFLGFLRIVSGFMLVIVIAITGFEYIVSPPNIKEEIKKRMLPIVIGIVLVFSAVSIAKFIVGAFEKAPVASTDTPTINPINPEIDLKQGEIKVADLVLSSEKKN